MNSFLVGLLIIFFSFSVGLENNYFGFLNGEGGLIEIIQIIILFSTLIIQIKNRKLYSKFCKRSLIGLRNLILIFLLYEELSFFTINTINFFTKNNFQGETNLHNLNLVYQPIFYLNIYGDLVGVNFYFLFVSLILFLFGYGSYLIPSEKIKTFFLEKKYSFYTFVFFLNSFISFILRHFNFISRFYLIDLELIELFLYLILMLDLFEKKLKFTSQIQKELLDKNF
tara:strand:+ start:69 stop:746 length:678 start_codon:yes stop_codon:yes gene_type:complete